MPTDLNPNVKSAGQCSTHNLESWKICQVDKRDCEFKYQTLSFFKVKQIKWQRERLAVWQISLAQCVNINLWTIADVVNIGSTDEFVVLEF